MSIKRNIEDLLAFRPSADLNDVLAWSQQVSATGRTVSPLREQDQFGNNPGNLRMLSFAPTTAGPSPALVVALHGCGQDAIAFDLGAGWSTLAERFGFMLLTPGQRPANNPNNCFNWFDASHTTRGSGEVASIKSMIDALSRKHGIDRARIFVTGLSAGGAMASALLATYPETFAGGAIIAGLPYGVAGSMRHAISAMLHPVPRSHQALGDLVRGASEHRGAWPRVAIWHGASDRTVAPANAQETVKQWLDVHALPHAPMSRTLVDGHTREVWWDAEGAPVIEAVTVAGMGHGVPLGQADDGRAYGAAGPFMLEAGISSTYHIARFFGLTRHVAAVKTEAAPPRAALRTPPPTSSPTPTPLTLQTDIRRVINRAFVAAGLVKR